MTIRRSLAAALAVALLLAIWPLGAALTTEGQAPITATEAGQVVTIPAAADYTLTYTGPGGYTLTFLAHCR